MALFGFERWFKFILNWIELARFVCFLASYFWVIPPTTKKTASLRQKAVFGKMEKSNG